MAWSEREPYLEEVAPGVAAYVQPDGSWMINNTGLIVSPSGRSIVVDTCSTEVRTRAFLAHVAERSTGEPMALVNTHHHPDHTYGNWLLPGSTPVVGHHECRAEVLHAGLEAMKVVTEPDYGAVQVRPPTVTFADALTLHLDDIPVELRHVGPAHTTNDVLVWLPEQRTLFAGDLVFVGGQPFLFEGSLAGFPGALAAIRAYEPKILVPGHGPVCRGEAIPALLDNLSRYVEFVDEIARAGYAAGLTPLETSLRNRDNPFRDWQESERLAGNLRRAFSELSGEPIGTRLSMAQAWPDMVAFHGGPIHCHA